MTEAQMWLVDGSEDTVRKVLARMRPELATAVIRPIPRVMTSNPEFFQGRAVIEDRYVVKFAWAEGPARRLRHEMAVLDAMSLATHNLPVPRLVGGNEPQVLLVTELVAGRDLTFDDASTVDGDRRTRLIRDLAEFLARLHDPQTLAGMYDTGVTLEAPQPQATTEMLRDRLGAFISARQQGLVRGWCDSVDDVLARPAKPCFVHGDFGGHNFVWDPDSGRLRLVADWETAGVCDAAYDFRYLPAHAATVQFFTELVEEYQIASGQPLDLERVMAWHVRTSLGDALWRSEAGVELPGGGPAADWVEEVAERLDSLGL